MWTTLNTKPIEPPKHRSKHRGRPEFTGKNHLLKEIRKVVEYYYRFTKAYSAKPMPITVCTLTVEETERIYVNKKGFTVIVEEVARETQFIRYRFSILTHSQEVVFSLR
ncbi:MAG: hypothetical protein K8Q91_01150 [Candidatus Vogelbacteria bacterium]|nr:hypothetical protein [Candidatus Vogelbacteria bacterium]